MIWRNSKPSDDAELYPFFRAFYVDDPSTLKVTDKNFQDTVAEFRENPMRGRIVVLQSNTTPGKIAGYALLAAFWSNELGGELCVLDELYVQPSDRRKGFARLLIQEVLKGNQDLWSISSKFIELEVSPKNSKARLLYEGMGFKTIRNSVMRRALP